MRLTDENIINVLVHQEIDWAKYGRCINGYFGRNQRYFVNICLGKTLDGKMTLFVKVDDLQKMILDQIRIQITEGNQDFLKLHALYKEKIKYADEIELEGA